MNSTSYQDASTPHFPSFQVSPDGSLACAGSSDKNSIWVFDIKNRTFVKEISLNEDTYLVDADKNIITQDNK